MAQAKGDGEDTLSKEAVKGDDGEDVLAALSLPWELRWRPSLVLLSTPFVPGFIAAICYGNIIATLFGWISYPSSNVWWGTIFAALLSSTIFGAAELLIVGFTRKRMVITKDGITQIKYGRMHIIAWKEARLFLKTGYVKQIYYELSSATSIIRWQGGWEGILKVNFTDDDIANVNDLVVARTGLPLIEPTLE